MSDLVQDAGSIRALSADIAAGRLTSVALVERCLTRIAAVDDQVRAWVSVRWPRRGCWMPKRRPGGCAGRCMAFRSA
jgi:Asp-tRNA(Asn)/Glu-tRNA(Gln) amidotransferase A subunit family amidase